MSGGLGGGSWGRGRSWEVVGGTFVGLKGGLWEGGLVGRGCGEVGSHEEGERGSRGANGYLCSPSFFSLLRFLFSSLPPPTTWLLMFFSLPLSSFLNLHCHFFRFPLPPTLVISFCNFFLSNSFPFSTLPLPQSTPYLLLSLSLSLTAAFRSPCPDFPSSSIQQLFSFPATCFPSPLLLL